MADFCSKNHTISLFIFSKTISDRQILLVDKFIKNVETADRSPQIATTKLAVLLVGQVLDEACVIVNAGKEFAQPWHQVTKAKKISNDTLDKLGNENLTFTVEMGDTDDINIKEESNAMTTSTPQKSSDIVKRNVKTDAYIIGQGDEDIYTERNDYQEQSDLNRSTSTFINRLFDMSDVEYILDDANITQKEITPNYLLYEEMFNIVESCVEDAVGVTFSNEIHKCNLVEEIGKSQISGHSSYSLLDDAYSNDFARNRAFYIDDDVATCSGAEGQKNSFDENKATNMANENIQPKDVAVYENAYVTLNKDYEQYSDEEECVQQDLKSLALQEVELSATNTSSVKLTTVEKIAHKDLAATSAVSPSTISRKSGIVRRCRLQGARFLSCLRGWWWRRKLPGRRKEPRLPGTVRGQSPLTPSAKQRAASLMDHRLARSPSPSRCPVWKFNTINEAMVNSAQWNEYAFEMKPNCDN